MKTTDLMLNDLVKFTGIIKTLKVNNIHHFGIEYSAKVDCGELEEDYITPEDIEPIPLTVEILKKNGIIYQEDYESYVDEEEYIFINLPNDSDGAEITIKDAGGDTGYMRFLPAYREHLYVHELQQVLRLCGYEDLANNFKI